MTCEYRRRSVFLCTARVMVIFHVKSAVCINCTVRKITFTPTRITNYYYSNRNTHWTRSVTVQCRVTVEVVMVINFGVFSWQSEHRHELYWWLPSQWSNLWVKRSTDDGDRLFRACQHDTARNRSSSTRIRLLTTAHTTAQSPDGHITRWHIRSVDRCVHMPHAI